MPIRRDFAALLFAGLTALAASGAGATGRCDLAIVHVNLVPMTTEAILPDRTIRIQGGRIAAFVKTGALGPRCRATVDAHGSYLLPGLNDLHIHLDTAAFDQALRLKARPVDLEGAMAPYLANGVTGVRVMSGAPDILAFRDRARAAGSALPRLVVASPMLSGDPPVIPEPLTRVVASPEAARAAIDEYAAAGYDFIKVRDNLKAPVLRAIIDQAARRGLYVDGHISQGQGLGPLDVLTAGQHAVAHIDNFALAMKTDADAAIYAKALIACGCFVSTTLEVETNATAQIEHYDMMIARPGVKLMDPVMIAAFWAKPNNGYIASKADPAFFRGLLAKDGLLLRTFTAAGVHVVAGTDALNPMILPGESLHDELDAMVDAGLTPYQALKTATVNPAAYVPGFADVGELKPGRAANALLVAANPLKNLKTLRMPLGVMINGHWLTAKDLAKGLDRAAASNAGQALGRRQMICGAALALAPGLAAAGAGWAAVGRRLAADYPADGPGAAAIAADDGHIAFVRGFGLADMELAVPLRPDSVVRLASLTKQFTVVAILKLAEAGRLALDDGLSERLEGSPTNWRPITLRQLLSHTSGLTGDMSAIFERPLIDRTPEELLAPYRDRPLLAPPGALWSYSNLNYWLLGKVIEAVGGEPYAAHIARHVLAPSMTRTCYGDVAAIIPGRALGYEREAGQPWRNARAFSQTIGYAAGGFLSTPLDMARWYAALGRGEIVSRRMLDLAGQELRTTDGKPTGYGLGWYVSDLGGDRVLHHGGSSVGFNAYVFWVPARRLFAGVFKNSSDERGEPRAEARAVLEVLRAARP